MTSTSANKETGGRTADPVEQQRKHFEGISARYYSGRQSRNHLLLKDLLWSYFFQGKDDLKQEGMRVLEPMCGYAEGKLILDTHLSVAFSYEGFDLSDTLLNTVKEQSPALNVYRTDITKWSPERQYDLVILIGGLHHVHRSAGAVMENISRALAGGGHFISFEPTWNSAPVRVVHNLIYRRHPGFDQETERRFHLRELNDLYRSAGLSVVDQIYPGLLAYVLYYNPDFFPALDIGTGGITRFLFNVDKRFFRSAIGRSLSFATLTLLRKAPS